MTGLWIVLEGPKGCGKTSVIEALKAQLPGDKFWFTSEPTPSRYTREAARLVAEGLHAEAANYFSLDRAEHMKIVAEKRAAGVHVIQSRCFISTVVLNRRPDEPLFQLVEQGFNCWGRPSLLVMFAWNCDPATAHAHLTERLNQRTPPDGDHPQNAFAFVNDYAQLNENLTASNNVIAVDAFAPISEVVEAVAFWIEETASRASDQGAPSL